MDSTRPPAPKVSTSLPAFVLFETIESRRTSWPLARCAQSPPQTNPNATANFKCCSLMVRRFCHQTRALRSGILDAGKSEESGYEFSKKTQFRTVDLHRFAAFRIGMQAWAIA